MRSILIATLFACQSKAPPPAPGSGSAESPAVVDVLTQFKHFESDMCACNTKACTDKVNAGLKEWADAQAKAGLSPPEMTAAQRQEMTALGESAGRCMQKAITMDPTKPETAKAP